MDNGVNDVNIIENSIEFSVTLRSEAVKRIGRLEESLFISYYRRAIIAKAVRLTFSGRPSFREVGLLGGLGGFLDAVGGGEWGPIVGSTLIARNHNPKLVIGSVNLAEFFRNNSRVHNFLHCPWHGSMGNSPRAGPSKGKKMS